MNRCPRQVTIKTRVFLISVIRKKSGARKTDKHQRVMLFPVRRRLAVLACANLIGIYLAQLALIPAQVMLLACALAAVFGILRAKKRKSALFCGALVVLMLGNRMAGNTLYLRDEPSQPGVLIVGEVDEIKRENRVWLKNAVCDGKPCARRVLVTLMTKEDEAPLPVAVGQTVTGTGRLFAPNEPRNPGDSNGRIRALTQRYELSGYVLPGWEKEGEARFSIREMIRRVRETWMIHLEKVFGEHAPLFQAILLGNRENMDDDVVNAMRLTGIVHLLTVSGMHLTLIALVFEKLLSRLTWGRWPRFFIQTVGLLFYTLLTGAAAGTVRALIMATLRGLAKCRGRRYEPLTALAFAAWLMSWMLPIWPLDASFQFSFFVLLGLLLLGETFSAGLLRHCAWARRHSKAANALAVSMSAQMAAVPIQLLFYGYIPLFAIPVNGIAGLLMPVVMLGGLFCSVVGLLLPTAGRFIGGILGVGIDFAESLVLRIAQWDVNVFRLPAPYGWMIPVAMAAMMLCSRRIRFGPGRKRAFAAAICVLTLGYLPRFMPDARYVQLDVGQGDAAVLRHGRHATIVDVGPENAYAVLRYLRHEGLYVDTALLSHLDEDHAGALGTLLASEVKIRRIVMPDYTQLSNASAAVQQALHLANEKGIPVETTSAGMRIHSGDFVFDVLSPSEGLVGDNERSLVLYTETMGTRILMTGDLPAKSEMDAPPDCDVLKVAQHGSKYATSDAFLAKTTPEIAIISVGANNRYGHPTERVLRSLDEIGAKVYRTDESGCITVWLSERRTTVQTYLNTPSSNGKQTAYTP